MLLGVQNELFSAHQHQRGDPKAQVCPRAKKCTSAQDLGPRRRLGQLQNNCAPAPTGEGQKCSGANHQGLHQTHTPTLIDPLMSSAQDQLPLPVRNEACQHPPALLQHGRGTASLIWKTSCHVVVYSRLKSHSVEETTRRTSPATAS